jgi:glycerol transport system ATP-binding protein
MAKGRLANSMPLELHDVTKRVGAETHIHGTSISFADGSFNVLLGATRSGKTTLMQLMAGIQKPTSGRIIHDGKDVTPVAVQKRNVSMVYQQFINYPMLSVYENIASPLRVLGLPDAEIKSRVGKASELLRLTPMLDRKPSQLSGGQQQRTAIARAIVKDSDLIFMDEPLANLDYKLREELRDELPKLFAGRKAIVFYATTEPHEALLFGGSTATLHEGRITQYGPTAEIYREPNTLQSAQVFSDPPINVVRGTKRGKSFEMEGGQSWSLTGAAAARKDGRYAIGIRPHHIVPVAGRGKPAAGLAGKVLVTEISGSESVVHFASGGQTWVSQSAGVHAIRVGEEASFEADIARGIFFDEAGRRVS